MHASTPDALAPAASARFAWLVKLAYRRGAQVQRGTCAQGVLMARGALQQLRNGRVARARVPHQLPAAFAGDESQLYLRTTDVPRTIQSAEAFWLGAFDGFVPPAWNKTKRAAPLGAPAIAMETTDLADREHDRQSAALSGADAPDGGGAQHLALPGVEAFDARAAAWRTASCAWASFSADVRRDGSAAGLHARTRLPPEAAARGSHRCAGHAHGGSANVSLSIDVFVSGKNFDYFFSCFLSNSLSLKTQRIMLQE